ncbi:hypothetical protein QFZ30_002484 [Arthrobacter pascens]|nr:hypothetical protein [Arthrobacter pascens]
MKLIGMIRSKETKTIEVEVSSLNEGRAQLDAMIPEGWELQHIRTEK